MSEKLTWGEVEPLVEEYSSGYTCLNPDCGLREEIVWLDVEKNFQKIVSVKEASIPKGIRPYAVVFECPECFSHFWYHINKGQAEIIKEMKYNP